MRGRHSFRHRGVLPRFRDAFAGFVQAYRQEPNLRFHLFAAACAAVAAHAVGLGGWEAGYLGLTVLGVLFAEMVNTAVERTVDLAAGGRPHPLAAEAKQVAAGAVLLAALHAAAVGGYLFLIRHSPGETLRAVLAAVAEQPWIALGPVLAAVTGLLAGRSRRGS